MGVALSFLFLIIFLAAFFGLDQFVQGLQAAGLATVSGDNLILATVGNFQISVSLSAIQTFLAAGAVFFEFVIILSLFDNVLNALKTVVRPLLLLLPLVIFLYSAYVTFLPVVRSLLPPALGGADPTYLAQAATNDLPRNLLITFGALVFFLLMSSLLTGSSTSEANRLRSELKKCRDQQRRV